MARSTRLHLPILLALTLCLQGCGVIPLNSHTNQPSSGAAAPETASTAVSALRGQQDVMVILALSGGGSRAAYFSTKVMLELERLQILEEVDAIAAVSGGSLAAAYYAVTDNGSDPKSRYRPWPGKEKRTLEKMRKNYIARWFGNWFWPHNIARFWFTKYDRTDIMAQTFADNLFDQRGLGKDYKLSDLNPERPYLVLNATNATEGVVTQEVAERGRYDAKSRELISSQTNDNREFGEPFRFTKEYFDSIDSDLGSYSLARAVMATATFPAVFNYMTLRDYSVNAADGKPRYLHLFDGGTHDNQGITAVEEILLHSRRRYETDPELRKIGLYDKVVVILVDVHTGKAGVSSTRADGRSFVDFVVDTNFIDATDSLLFANRESRVENFYEQNLAEHFVENKSIYYHITFDQLTQDPELMANVKGVPTNFSLSKKNASYLEEAGAQLINRSNSCIAAILDLIRQGTHSGQSNCKPDWK